MATNPPQHTLPSGSRKRKCNPESWVRNKSKRARQTGEEYISDTNNTVVAARKVGPPCNCNLGCFALVGEENINRIHHDYWSLGDHTLQTAFIQNCATESAVKKHYTIDVTKHQDFRRTYHVLIDGKLVTICRTALGNILGVGNSRVGRAVKKKTAGGAIIPDMRGRASHSSVGQVRLNLVLEHMKSFPTVSSHYSRKDRPDAKYLDADISSKVQMWQLYKKWLDETHPDEQPVKAHYYRDCITEHFPHLKLDKPRSDTCKTCDIYKIKIQEPDLSQIEKRKLAITQDLHLLKAERGYKLPQEIKADSGADTMVICLDLQAALTTPKITTGVSFYMRKSVTLNFGIHDYKTGKGYMFVWDEVTAKRGAAEISSCIYKFVTTIVPPTVKKLYIFSDNCPGQNKNNILVLFYLYLIQRLQFVEIVHLYFKAGHTYMAADRHFGTIEKAINRRAFVFTPDCYIDIIKKCRDSGGNSM